MKALLLKDLRVLRPWWWLIVPGHMLFGANGIVAPQSFFAVNVALTLAVTAILLVVDWTQEADRFVGSLPVSRVGVVRARYAWALGAAVGGTLLYALYGRVLMSVATERLLARWPEARGWDSMEGLLAFFLTVWLISVAYLPFYFRFGLGRGTWLFLASAAPLIVGGVALARWLPSPGTLNPVAGALGPAALAVVSLAVVAALGWPSLRLSVRFFGGRDL